MKPIGNRGIRSLVMATALSIGLGFVTHASAQTYLVDLKAKTATYIGLDVIGINDAGQVVGSRSTSNTELHAHAFITGPNGVGMTDLGIGGVWSVAGGINNTGQMAVNSAQGPVFITTGPNGVGVRDLGTLGATYSGFATDINNAGQVVGVSSTAAGQEHVFITGPNGVGMTDLGIPGQGGGYNFFYRINDAGQVAGQSGDWPNRHAFITGPNGLGIRDLGTLGGNDTSWASGINDVGQVVGSSSLGSGPAHAFITGPNGMGMRDIGTLGGGWSYARDINDAGQVVGNSFTAEGLSSRAFVTGPNGVGMTDLSSLVHLPGGNVVENAVAINNIGQVIVTAGTYVIPAVPEPESYALMLAGLVLTGVMVRRKQKAVGGKGL